jgi:hypothetical protein
MLLNFSDSKCFKSLFVLLSSVTEAHSGIGHSKVRVMFDNEKSLAKSVGLSVSFQASPAFVSGRSNDHIISRYSSLDKDNIEFLTPSRLSLGSPHSNPSVSASSISSRSSPNSPMMPPSRDGHKDRDQHQVRFAFCLICNVILE